MVPTAGLSLCARSVPLLQAPKPRSPNRGTLHRERRVGSDGNALGTNLGAAAQQEKTHQSNKCKQEVAVHFITTRQICGLFNARADSFCKASFICILKCSLCALSPGSSHTSLCIMWCLVFSVGRAYSCSASSGPTYLTHVHLSPVAFIPFCFS